MAYRLACELSNRIAAIASVTGLQAFFPCNPPKPVPVLDMHGTADPVVPYVGVASTISFWVEHNGCPQEPVITDLPDINQTDSSTVTTSYYGSCNNSTEVILYTIKNGEHSWPGSIIMLGVTNKDINASNEIWNFFRKFNLQGSTGIDLVNSQNNNLLSIYPNPARSFLTVEIKSSIPEIFDFQIFDMSGRKVNEVLNISDPRFIVDCHDLPSGMYIAGIRYKSGLMHQKLIIR
jgi:polyhydroxybutyrate depolymerase